MRPVAALVVVCVAGLIAGTLVLVLVGKEHAQDSDSRGALRASLARSAEQWKYPRADRDMEADGRHPRRDMWQQNTTGGPPPGYLACPSPSACFTMSGAGARVADGRFRLCVSESLYVSADAGATWAQRPIPQGFDPTEASLACGGVSQGLRRPAGRTTDSRSSSPLPMVVSLSPSPRCPPGWGTSTRCHAPRLGTAPVWQRTASSSLSGGPTQRFSPRVTEARRSVTARSSLVIRWNRSAARRATTVLLLARATPLVQTMSPAAARTTDGGRKWSVGMLPAGFGISPNSQLSCADGSHCSVIGLIDITVQNSPSAHRSCGRTRAWRPARQRRQRAPRALLCNASHRSSRPRRMMRSSRKRTVSLAVPTEAPW